MFHQKRGFTLIELLVVIAIIAILAAILFPVFSKAREKARQAACTSNQKQIALSVQIYSQENEEALPVATSTMWSDLGLGAKIQRCATAGNKVTNAYLYNYALSGKALGKFDDPTTIAISMDGMHTATPADAFNGYAATIDNVAYEPKDVNMRHGGKFIASYLDGHVALSNDTGSLALSGLPLAGGFTPGVDLFSGLQTTVQSGGAAMLATDVLPLENAMNYDMLTAGQGWAQSLIGASNHINGGSRADGQGAIPYGNAPYTTEFGGQYQSAKYTSFEGNPAPCLVVADAHDWNQCWTTRTLTGTATNGWAVSGAVKTKAAAATSDLVGFTSASLNTASLTTWNTFIIRCRNGVATLIYNGQSVSVTTGGAWATPASLKLGSQWYNGAGANAWNPPANFRGMWFNVLDSGGNTIVSWRIGSTNAHVIFWDDLKWGVAP